MIILGILLIAAGVCSIVYGSSLNNSWEAQLESFFNSGSSDPGTIWIIIGAVVAVIGLILLIAGVSKRDNSPSPVAHSESITPVPTPKPNNLCPKCNAPQETDSMFCRFCGTAINATPTPTPTPTPAPTPTPPHIPTPSKGDRNAICPHCGARQSSSNTNCKYCGTAMK